MAKELVPNEGQTESNFCNLEQSSTEVLSVWLVPSRRRRLTQPGGANSIRCQGWQGKKHVLVTAQMNNSRDRKQLPFLDGFLKPAFIN